MPAIALLARDGGNTQMTDEMDRRREGQNQARTAEEYRMRDLARMVAEETIRGTFKMLGIDINDQDSVNRMRDDLNYLHEMKSNSTSSQRERKKSLYQNLGALIVGLLLCLVGYYVGKTHGLP